MINVSQIEKRVRRLQGKHEKKPRVILIRPAGTGWTLQAQLWDGAPEGFNQKTDCYYRNCETLEAAQALADDIVRELGGNPSIIIGDILQ